MSGARRLMKEWKEWNTVSGQYPDISSMQPDTENLFLWSVVINGPKSTFYAGGKWNITIECPTSYPMEPPQVRFLTPICHPNIHWKTGEVCLDVLKSNWTPAWTLVSIVTAILVLLEHPEPDSPLNCDAAKLLRLDDRVAYNSLIRCLSRR